MTDQELTEWFNERRRQREQDRQTMREYIRSRLASGGAIIEGGYTRWSLTGTSHWNFPLERRRRVGARTSDVRDRMPVES